MVGVGGVQRKSLWSFSAQISKLHQKVKLAALLWQEVKLLALQKQEVKQEVGFQEILGFDLFPHSVMVFIKFQDRKYSLYTVP